MIRRYGPFAAVAVVALIASVKYEDVRRKRDLAKSAANYINENPGLF